MQQIAWLSKSSLIFGPMILEKAFSSVIILKVIFHPMHILQLDIALFKFCGFLLYQDTSLPWPWKTIVGYMNQRVYNCLTKFSLSVPVTYFYLSYDIDLEKEKKESENHLTKINFAES